MRGHKKRSDSAGSEKVKDERADELKAARIQYLWNRLRETILDTVNASLENDVKERYVSHGVHFQRQIMHRNPIITAFYNSKTDEFISLDDDSIRLFHSSGMKKDIVMPVEDINRLCHIRHINSYVGWKYKHTTLYLYGHNFDHYSKTDAPSEIYQVTYNEPKEELIVCGNGYLQSYVFRFGNRHLISRHTRMEDECLEGQELELVALEDTPSRTQKCFVAFANCVAVFTVTDTQLVTWKKNLHQREVSSLVFFNPLKYLITGSDDGSIKVWSSDWKLQFVFVGHTKRVTGLAVYPWSPQFMSISNDETLRVWNLEVFDQVDKQELDELPIGIFTSLGHRNFCTFSDHVLHLWTVDDLHRVHTIVGQQVQSVKCTIHPNFPMRGVAICSDSTVRILAPQSGEVITTLMLDSQEHSIIDTAYSIADELLFVVLEGGDILKCSTSTNPCTILARWSYPEISLCCNYLLIYEYVIGNQSNNPWKNIARAFATRHLEKALDDVDEEPESGRSTPQQPIINKSQDRTLLLGGRKDGYLCVLNMKTGQVEFSIEGHGSKGVLSMIANSPDDQVMSAGRAKSGVTNMIISAGHDNVIKVWRLFPYAVEALSPMMSFYCSQTPLHMCIMTGKLGVAFHEHASATYSVVVYNISNKARKDHSPEVDHTDTITALTACQRMKLFASASQDGTVRIWSDTNQLVRQLKLNATPHSLEFVDTKGSLIVGIGKNLHRIDSSDMLPGVYKFKQITMRFKSASEESRVKFDAKALAALSKKDLKRLQGARPAYRYERYSDELTEEERELLTSEEKAKKDAYEALINREEDVLKLRNGEIKVKNLPPRNRHTRNEAFIRYLSIFYDRPDVKLYEEDKFAIDTAKSRIADDDEFDGDFTKYEDQGFFPPPDKAGALPVEDLLKETGFNVEEDKPILEAGKDRSIYPSDPRGFLPNSVLVRLLFPEESEQASAAADKWRPPRLSDKQLAEIGQTRGPKSVADLAEEKALAAFQLEKENTEVDRVLMLSDDEGPSNDMLLQQSSNMKKKKPKKKKVKVSFGFPDEPEPQDSIFDAPKKPTGFTDPKKAAANTGNSFLNKIGSILTRPATPPPPREPTPPPPPSPTKKLPAAPRKPLVKLVSSGPPPKPPPPKPKTPSPPPKEPTPTPTPPPPPSPLPEFVTQFFADDWFQQYFPNCSSHTFPKPWTVEHFVSQLLRILKMADYKVKVHVAAAIRKLYHTQGFRNLKEVSEACLEVLSPAINPPTSLDPQQLSCIKLLLSLLHDIGCTSMEFYIELMCQFIDGDQELRSFVIETFNQCGLNDRHHFFTKEIDSWDTWAFEGVDRKSKVAAMCEDWLEKWMTKFKTHLREGIEMLKKGQAVHTRVGRGGKRAPERKSYTVTFNEPPNSSVIEKATWIECINYFCEMEVTAQMSKVKAMQQSDDKLVETKNTVLVLPKMRIKPALVRLGELHTGATNCKPERETVLNTTDLRRYHKNANGEWALPPGQLHGFVPFIKQPVTRVYMNPFPSRIDKYDHYQQDPILITLKTSPKYFIHDESYPISETVM